MIVERGKDLEGSASVLIPALPSFCYNRDHNAVRRVIGCHKR